MISWSLKITLIIFLIVCTFYRIFANINQPVARWDESTNIQVVQETRLKKSFPILSYNNEPFFRKPPLWYYLNIPLSYSNLRLISIISAILIIALCVIFVYQYFGFLSSMITWMMLLTSSQLFVRNPGGIFSTHTLTSADLDSLQILFILIAFMAGLIKNKYSPIICGIAVGLAVLTKGPLGFLPLIVLILAGKISINAWLIAFTVILPWYIFMIIQFGQEFLYQHFVYHIFYRISSTLEGHNGSLIYYLQILTNLFIFPTFPLVTIAIFLLKFIKKISSIIILCGTMALASFLIPTLMDTKLAWYILPAYPFIAMFTGMVIGTYLKNTNKFLIK